ncbi:hypothetical protein JCM8547_009011 [Rhodosporidiobolus lusitaniae]
MPKHQPGNPDWVQWVEEIANRADERGEKSAQTYKRAAHSLRSCPIPMHHPDEALALKGVGPKIVQILTAKLREQCEKEGRGMPDRVPSPTKRKAPTAKGKKRDAAAVDENPEDDPRFARRLKTMGASAAAASGSADLPAFRAHPDAHVWNEPMSEGEEEFVRGAGSTKGKGKSGVAVVGGEKEKKTRGYIPRQNSGAYAILLALYRCCSADEPEQWTTKQRIMDVGQEYSTTPFETGTAVRAGQVQGGQGFSYSAWNGMKTLTTKNLAQTDNKRPAKYSLTPSGYTLAEKLAPSASIPLHVPCPSSSSQAHPSSSRSQAHPSSSSAVDPARRPVRPALQILGGPGSSGHQAYPYLNPKRAHSASVHASTFRRRSPTPELGFLQQPPSPPPEEAERLDTEEADGMEEDGDDGGDEEFRRQMKQALELSRRESLACASASGSFSSSPSGSSSGFSGEGRGRPSVLDPAAVARRAAGEAALARASRGNGGGGGAGGLDGRKAASGEYAKEVRREAEEREEREERERLAGGRGVKNVDSALGYFYLDEHSQRTVHRHLAEVSQTSDSPPQTTYRIEYRCAQDLHPMVRGLVNPVLLTRPEGKVLPGGVTKEAYMKERVSAERAPGFPEGVMKRTGGGGVGEKGKDKGKGKEKEKEREGEKDPDPVRSLLAGFKALEKKSRGAMYEAPKEVRRLGAAAVEDEDGDLFADLDVLGGPPAPIAPVASRSTSGFRPATSTSIPASIGVTVPSLSSRPSPKQTRPSLASTTTSTVPRPPSRSTSASLPHTSTQNPLLASFDSLLPSSHNGTLINRHPLDPFLSHTPPSSFSPPTPSTFKPLVWPAGTFKIFLVVDSREGTREAGKRVELCEKMEQQGVPVERRMLPLGDMVWVAKRWDYARGRLVEDGGGGGDVVLDAIVERKRLDDLCMSIIDGRYVGQKFRYKDSGISHRIYLIEKYDAATYYERFGKQIWTCKSQLQVNDGFYVHESANIADTINYLKKRTQVMQELYENSPLHIIPDALIDRPSYLSLQHSLRTFPHFSRLGPFLTSYASFTALNKPDAALTLRSQWGSMIQRVNGVSAEKAVQFLGRWETPGRFWEEAREHEREVERENALLNQEEALQPAGGPKRGAGKKKEKRRKAEDYVVEEVEDQWTRGIKGKVGGRIWEVFMTRGGYPAGQ